MYVFKSDFLFASGCIVSLGFMSICRETLRRKGFDFRLCTLRLSVYASLLPSHNSFARKLASLREESMSFVCCLLDRLAREDRLVSYRSQVGQ